MSTSETKFLSLLFEEGRELKNLKFFPGPECASSEQLFTVSYDAIVAAMGSDQDNMIPQGDAGSVSIAEFVASL